MEKTEIPAHRREVFTRSGNGEVIDPGTAKPKAKPAPAPTPAPNGGDPE